MSQTLPIVLGIDGGGTKTLAAIIDGRGRMLGRGQGGPSNIDDVGVATATVSIAQAVDQAREQAGLERLPFSAAFLGLAGVVSARDRQLVLTIAESLDLARPENIEIDHDCRIALAGGLSGRPGIVLIAGTGSSCFGANGPGRTWRSGGWGSLISDEGSGYWLGREGLIATVRTLDGRGPTTTLTEAMLERLEVAQPDDLLHRIYVTSLSRAEVAALATSVIGCARGGDAVALDLIRLGAEALAECVDAVARQLGFDDGACELALVGGLLQAGEIVLAPLRRAVLERLPNCQLTWPELPPVLGACLLALKQIGTLHSDVVTELRMDTGRALAGPTDISPKELHAHETNH